MKQNCPGVSSSLIEIRLVEQVSGIVIVVVVVFVVVVVVAVVVVEAVVVAVVVVAAALWLLSDMLQAAPVA